MNTWSIHKHNYLLIYIQMYLFNFYITWRNNWGRMNTWRSRRISGEVWQFQGLVTRGGVRQGGTNHSGGCIGQQGGHTPGLGGQRCLGRGFVVQRRGRHRLSLVACRRDLFDLGMWWRWIRHHLLDQFSSFTVHFRNWITWRHWTLTHRPLTLHRWCPRLMNYFHLWCFLSHMSTCRCFLY